MSVCVCIRQNEQNDFMKWDFILFMAFDVDISLLYEISFFIFPPGAFLNLKLKF